MRTSFFVVCKNFQNFPISQRHLCDLISIFGSNQPGSILSFVTFPWSCEHKRRPGNKRGERPWLDTVIVMLWSPLLLFSLLPLCYGHLHDRFGGLAQQNLGNQWPESPPASMHLSSVEAGRYTLLTHPHFPSHRVRVKRTKFCDPTVK